VGLSLLINHVAKHLDGMVAVIDLTTEQIYQINYYGLSRLLALNTELFTAKNMSWLYFMVDKVYKEKRLLLKTLQCLLLLSVIFGN